MNRRATIRDVARIAGVSHTTASLALRNDGRISAGTRKKVAQAAAKAGYRPHAVVSDLMTQLRSLRQGEIHSTLGFITAWPTRDGWKASPNHRRFYDGALRRAGELGYKLEVFWVREPGMTSRRLSDILRHRGIRGLLLQSLPSPHGHLSLEWRHFAAVAKGLTIARPLLHRVLSSHYEDMRLVFRQLKRHGYRRPGLVLEARLNARVDRAWLAAYALQQLDLPAVRRVPALILEKPDDYKQFEKWQRQHQPEVILFSGLPVPDWVGRMGLRVPADIGLVHLDRSPETGTLAGIDADSEAIGAAAADLLVGQLQAHEFGIPSHEKIVLVKGRWHEGQSLRPPVGEEAGRPRPA